VEQTLSAEHETASLQEKFAVINLKQQTEEIRAKVCKDLLSGTSGKQLAVAHRGEE
jgi:hypothetical protein